jgi:hypothetical protein
MGLLKEIPPTLSFLWRDFVKKPLQAHFPPRLRLAFHRATMTAAQKNLLTQVHATRQITPDGYARFTFPPRTDASDGVKVQKTLQLMTHVDPAGLKFETAWQGPMNGDPIGLREKRWFDL